MEFSNPLPPQNYQHQASKDDSHPLTNDDFRKLMMTPRVGGATPATSSTRSSSTPGSVTRSDSTGGTSKTAEERRKKKIYFAKLNKLEEEKKKELDSKYRDRARERRDGKHTDENNEISTTADYRNVAPELKAGASQAEKRRQIIEESKYLGGDMEHTHLVKGLDYALLEKVRAEITNKEAEDDIEQTLDENAINELKDLEEEEVSMKSAIAKNVYRVLFQTAAPQKNEMFAPGRTAYVIDLEDEFPESDIPTTAIRSKADCPEVQESTTLSTNEIVIGKLTQILSYLRQGKRDRRKQKKDALVKGKEEQLKELMKPKDDVDMFGEAVAKKASRDDKHSETSRTRERKSNRVRDRSKSRDRAREERGREGREERKDRRERDRGRDDDKKRTNSSYFDKPMEKEVTQPADERKESTQQFIRGLTKQYSQKWNEIDSEKSKTQEPKAKKAKKKADIDHYAECYPGMEEAADAIIDSDDEADYTKMDMGNKKGPVNRWDFENDEQYQEYMGKKEAVPKAAFQYGVKMSDGRKTRRAAGGPKDDKAALDREWQQIQNIMSKREGKRTK